MKTLRDWAAGLIDPQPQDHSRATFSRKATKADARIDWTLPAEVIDRRIRAYHPWPGSFTTWSGPKAEGHSKALPRAMKRGSLGSCPGAWGECWSRPAAAASP